MSEYKYVILTDGERTFPVIMCGELVHAEVARGVMHAMGRRREHAVLLEPLSAGFLSIEVKTDPNRISESLNLGPTPKDQDIINLQPQTHGIASNIDMIKSLIAKAKSPDASGVSRDMVRAIGERLLDRGFKDVKGDLIRVVAAWVIAEQAKEGPRTTTQVEYTGELNCCPNCQALNVFVRQPYGDARYHVECRICDVRGPTSTSVTAAAWTWNHLPRHGAPVAYLRDAQPDAEDEALVVCSKGDPGAFPVHR